MLDTFLPTDDNHSGITTAQNDDVDGTSDSLTIGNGGHILVCIGDAPVFIRFGRANTAAVSATNGFRLPASWVGVLSVPEMANTIFYIQEGSASVISVQRGNVGT